jgi:hypothetical protein
MQEKVEIEFAFEQAQIARLQKQEMVQKGF